MFEMNNYRLFTVRYFFGKIVDIERFALRAAILDEFEIYLGGRGRTVWVEARNFFLAFFLSPLIYPRRPPPRYIWNQDGRPYR